MAFSEYARSIISTGSLAWKDCKYCLLSSALDSLAMDRLKADTSCSFYEENCIITRMR